MIGNLYDADWQSCLRASPCPNATCGCHIGYVHMPHLQLYPVYGEGVLERAAGNIEHRARNSEI